MPRPGALVELTQRTIQGRFLLRPDPELNRIVIGVLAKAQGVTRMSVHAVVVLSNHLHILASPTDVEQMAAFMQQVKTNLSKEVGRLRRWSGPMFDRRYTSIPVSDEAEAHVARLQYLLSQGVKEGLVMRPGDWPGVHCVDALTQGAPLRGIWIDRTNRQAASKPENGNTTAAFERPLELTLTPLPCWEHLDLETYRARVQDLVTAIEDEAVDRHRQAGSTPKGKTWVLRCSPRQRPRTQLDSSQPLAHAFRRRARQALVDAYRTFLVAYRIAADRLRSGEASVAFPEGCFPPRPPFVACSRLAPD